MDTQSWAMCMHSLVMLAIPVNCALVVFTLGSFDAVVCGHLDTESVCPPLSSSVLYHNFIIYKLTIFFVMISFVFILVFSVSTSIERIPKDVEVNSMRLRGIISNLVLLDAEHKEEGIFGDIIRRIKEQKKAIIDLTAELRHKQ